jgi:hypothetical protein
VWVLISMMRLASAPLFRLQLLLLIMANRTSAKYACLVVGAVGLHTTAADVAGLTGKGAPWQERKGGFQLFWKNTSNVLVSARVGRVGEN